MTVSLRIILVIVSILTFLYVMRKIRKSHIQIEYSVFWVAFTLLLLSISFFPKLTDFFATLIGVETPANFVYLMIIFMLIIQLFLLTIQVSQQNNQIKQLAQEIALQKFRKKTS